jgi:acetylornithine deacetylase/succinyl-diaminopimelate desuccinylase-like protein
VSNIVPGRAELVHEMRSADAATLERLAQACEALAREIGQRRGVGVQIHRTSATTPVACSPRVQAAVTAAAKALGLGCTTLYSAAGHDAQNLASITEAGMLFIPSRGGKSHRVDETSDADAIERGANVLLRTLLDLTA